MNQQSTENTAKARLPIASLLSKSEKAVAKLSSETWQHSMLKRNITALQAALRLMDNEPLDPSSDLQESAKAISDMLTRSEQAMAKFKPGPSSYTLQQNRISALRVALALVEQAPQRCTHK